MASSGQDVCEEVVIEIQKELSQVVKPSRLPDECCIYRVPKKLRKVNEDAYTPKLISIGPLHHGNKELGDMKMQKLIYFREFCRRPNKCDKDLARKVEENEVKIRCCYEEISELSSKEYVSMILLDAIFIIELFLRTSERKDDYIVSTPWLAINIRQDLILLENQLPLFILEDLFMSTNSNTSFLEHACAFFGEGQGYLKISRLENKVKHFTDLQRYFLCPTNLESGEGDSNLLYSATKLDEVGVKFKVDLNRPSHDIQFKRNMCLASCPMFNCSWILSCLPCLRCFPYLVLMQPFLEFRPIEMQVSSSESLIRNVMAFEQCHYPLEAYVCNYFLLLDQLIDTDKDAELLVQKRIIVNWLGSNKALATLINKLGLEIVVSNSCYAELNLLLNQHYDNFWNRHMASLTSVYFRDFWTGSATIVGLILLVLTIFGAFA